MESLCTCGRLWNKQCAMLSSDLNNSYEPRYSMDQLMDPTHSSGFYHMTGAQRMAYVMSGKDQIKSNLIHFRRYHPDDPDDPNQRPPSTAPSYEILNDYYK